MEADREKLQQVRELIEQHEYEEARNLLHTMSDNPTAHKWLVEVEKQIARQTRTAEAKEKLVEARELIKQKDYDGARAILEQMSDNSTAREWLNKLNRMPQSTTAPHSAGGGPDSIPDPDPMPSEYDASATRAQLLAHEQESGGRQQFATFEMDDALRQAQAMLGRVGIDVGGLAVKVLALGALAGFVTALIDAILGIPGTYFEFAFGWFAVVLIAPTYTHLKGKPDRAGLVTSAATGLVMMFVWYIVTAIVTGDPDFGNPSAREYYKYWFDEYMNLLKAMWLGALLGLMSFGWLALAPHLPRSIEDLSDLGNRLPGRQNDDTPPSA